MSMEDIVLRQLKISSHGMKFTTTTGKILETIVERVWFEDREGACLMEKISELIQCYMNFELRDAIHKHFVVKSEVNIFVSGLQNEVRIQSWNKIMMILEFLRVDAEYFLKISETKSSLL